MKRSEVLRSKGYWVADWQLKLFQMLDAYLEEEHLTKSQLAERLGCSKGYVSQIMNGDFDHKMSKLIELALAVGKVPELKFVDIDKMIWRDRISDSVATPLEQAEQERDAKYPTFVIAA